MPTATQSDIFKKADKQTPAGGKDADSGCHIRRIVPESGNSIIGSSVDSYILDEMYEKSQQELNDFYNETSIDIGIKDIKNIKDKIEILKERTKRTINHFVTLIVVFTLKTIFIPILTLWGLLTILGYIIKNNDSGRIVKSIGSGKHVLIARN